VRWRPIKTAPKDKLILLSCDENPEYPPYVCLGRWVDVPHSNALIEAWRAHKQVDKERIFPGWRESHIGVLGGNLGCSWEYCGCILFHPTHWQPLPEGAKTRRRR
jgi:hypothetical protein